MKHDSPKNDGISQDTPQQGGRVDPFVVQCGPKKTCPDGTPHDYSGWEEYEDGMGCMVGTAVCSKCGHRAFDDAMWMD
jgi:hypothetical protein